MAKYSKEQRDRAVDLYIKYEHCAAAESSSAGSSRSFLRSAASRASRWTDSSACSTTTWSGTGTEGSRRSSA